MLLFFLENHVSLWIGGEKDAINQWKWTTTEHEITWADWIPGQPDDSNEKCLEMRTFDSWAQSNGEWNNRVCGVWLMHVCEFVFN